MPFDCVGSRCGPEASQGFWSDGGSDILSLKNAVESMLTSVMKLPNRLTIDQLAEIVYRCPHSAIQSLPCKGRSRVPAVAPPHAKLPRSQLNSNHVRQPRCENIDTSVPAVDAWSRCAWGSCARFVAAPSAEKVPQKESAANSQCTMICHNVTNRCVTCFFSLVLLTFACLLSKAFQKILELLSPFYPSFITSWRSCNLLNSSCKAAVA